MGTTLLFVKVAIAATSSWISGGAAATRPRTPPPWPFERVGRGPPVVLLHGYVGDGSATWRPQVDALADHFTLVAWDAPGAGGSSVPPESYGMAGYADCLAEFIDALGLDRRTSSGCRSAGRRRASLLQRCSERRVLVVAGVVDDERVERREHGRRSELALVEVAREQRRPVADAVVGCGVAHGMSVDRAGAVDRKHASA
jgi:pimeloyl-ACP methyl ester carboxylesterase